MTSQPQAAPPDGDRPHEDVAETSDLLGAGGLLVDRTPSPRPPVVVECARYARERGRRDDATALLETALRKGGWTRVPLWVELVSLMEQPADYAPIRALWLESPERCHNNAAIMRNVARAACVAGEHEEGRALMRRAIIDAVAGSQRLPRESASGRVRGLIGRSTREAEGHDKAAIFQQDAAQALLDLNRVLDGLGVRPFLLGGTLLGFVRDGMVIPWDKDVDVGIFTTELEPRDIEREFAFQSNFSVRRLNLAADRLRVKHGNGVLVDIFPHYEDGRGNVYHDGAATRWWNKTFELKTVDFLGVSQYVPENPEHYLTESYGDWREPDPYFDARLDKPNVEVIDRPYFDSLHFFSLLSAVIDGDARKKERFIGLLRELGEGPWLERL